MSRPALVLRALVTAAQPGRSALAHVWCPWCETVHSHSADPGPRVAHCSDKGSPYKATGYSLDVAGTVRCADAVMPAGPLVGRSRFKDALEAVAPRIRATVLRQVVKRLRATPARLRMAGNAWTIELDPAAADRGAQLAGSGLLDLLAAVWGISPGIVVVRLVEALQGRKLNASARAALVDAVDRATSRPSDNEAGRA